ncbi:MAG: hypothetical protein HY921_10095 [Elusimicrobia bacterium]|nr:hypothetical protein [Elusimicrobiota bacterium]
MKPMQIQNQGDCARKKSKFWRAFLALDVALIGVFVGAIGLQAYRHWGTGRTPEPQAAPEELKDSVSASPAPTVPTTKTAPKAQAKRRKAPARAQARPVKSRVKKQLLPKPSLRKKA